MAHVQLGIRPGVLSILNEAVPAIARLHAGFALRIEGDAAHCPAVALRKEEGQARVLPLYSVALSKDRRSLRDQSCCALSPFAATAADAILASALLEIRLMITFRFRQFVRFTIMRPFEVDDETLSGSANRQTLRNREKYLSWY